MIGLISAELGTDRNRPEDAGNAIVSDCKEVETVTAFLFADIKTLVCTWTNNASDR
jgi:hypothetical protein